MTNTDAIGLGHNHILADTAATATATMIPSEDAPAHIVGTAENITGVLHNAQMHISTILTMTVYIESHLLTEAPWLTCMITADHALNQPTGWLRKPCIRIHHIPGNPMVIHALKEIQE